MLLNNRGSAAPFSLARLAWGFARALQSALPTRTSETRGENGGAHCLPAVSQALCCGQDNLANELVKRPLVTRLAAKNTAPTARGEFSELQNVYGTYPQKDLIWHLAVLNHEEGSQKTTFFFFF